MRNRRFLNINLPLDTLWSCHRVIHKKIRPIYFEKIISGDKTFELRLADLECHAGDNLLLREWDPNTKQYTGREIEKKVTCVLKTKDVKLWSQEEIDIYGFQIIFIKDTTLD